MAGEQAEACQGTKGAPPWAVGAKRVEGRAGARRFPSVGDVGKGLLGHSRDFFQHSEGLVGLAVQALGTSCEVHESAGRTMPIAGAHDDGSAGRASVLLGRLDRRVVRGVRWLGVGGTCGVALLALRAAAEVDVTAGGAAPVGLVLEGHVGRWRVGRARGVALLALRAPREVDVVALQAFPIRRVLGTTGGPIATDHPSHRLGRFANLALHPLSEVEVPALGVGAAPVARHEDRGLPGSPVVNGGRLCVSRHEL